MSIVLLVEAPTTVESLATEQPPMPCADDEPSNDKDHTEGAQSHGEGDGWWENEDEHYDASVPEIPEGSHHPEMSTERPRNAASQAQCVEAR